MFSMHPRVRKVLLPLIFAAVAALGGSLGYTSPAAAVSCENERCNADWTHCHGAYNRTCDDTAPICDTGSC